jgi:hypothetical protein
MHVPLCAASIICRYPLRIVWRRRSKSVLTIPMRALTAAASLHGRWRANNRRRGGEAKARNSWAQDSREERLLKQETNEFLLVLQFPFRTIPGAIWLLKPSLAFEASTDSVDTSAQAALAPH